MHLPHGFGDAESKLNVPGHRRKRRISGEETQTGGGPGQHGLRGIQSRKSIRVAAPCVRVTVASAFLKSRPDRRLVEPWAAWKSEKLEGIRHRDECAPHRASASSATDFSFDITRLRPQFPCLQICLFKV
jgi:hypothetical protein